MDLSSSLPAARVAVAYHSGYGHTARQAEAVARGAAAVPGTDVQLLNVAEVNDALWATLEAADAIVFGAPTYFGGPSGPFKVFADASVKVWIEQRWRARSPPASPIPGTCRATSSTPSSTSRSSPPSMACTGSISG